MNTATTTSETGSDRRDPLGGLPAGLDDSTADDSTAARDRHLDRSASVSSGSTGVAVAGFVLALGGASLGALALLGLQGAGLPGAVVSVIGIVLCAVGLGRDRARRGLAVAGLIIALLALPLDAVGALAVLSHLDTASTVTSTAITGASGAGGHGGRVVVENAAMISDASGGSDLYWRDQTFLEVLTEHGVLLDADQQGPVVGLGHQVAIYMTQGGTVPNAVQILVASGWSPYDANIVVGDAIGSYLSTS